MTAKRFDPPRVHWPARAAAAAPPSVRPAMPAQAKPVRAHAIPVPAPLNLRRMAAPALAQRAAQPKPAPPTRARGGPWPQAPRPPLAPAPAGRIVQRAARAIPDDVLPFVDEGSRGDIKSVDITADHKGTYAFQVTKVRNLPGIRRSGLMPSAGGSRIGLSQNPSQRDSLLARSLKHSRGRVTVGTGSIVIDNYRKKAQEWHDRLEADLTVLARSDDDGALYVARARLRGMAWLHDPLLDELLGFPLEDSAVRARDAALTLRVREAYRLLLFNNWLNKPYILRLPSKSASWTVDPDDPQGFQTEASIGVVRIEVLLDGAWVRLADPEIADYLDRIQAALADEREALEVGRELARLRRQRMGLMGADVPRDLPSDIADMMNL